MYCELAPIDIDPIHGMDDPQSPPRQEYKRFVYQWAKIMQGRLAIYDYRFEWEADLTGKVKAGENKIALCVNNPHHFGGIFRRPFFYKPIEK